MSDNKKHNKTEEFDQDDLIVRRACSFKVTVEFDREVNELGDVVRLDLTTGAKPTNKSGTMVRMYLDLNKDDCDYDDTAWFMTGTVNGVKLTLDVNIPEYACIGKYKCKLYIRTTKIDDEFDSEYYKLKPLYVLANPYSPRDGCWNANGDEGDFWNEYVRNENGAVWRSGSKGPSAKPWVFGQFDPAVLDVACHLLTADKRTQSEKGGAKLADLVQITRIISAMANSNNNDSGVLTGKWDGKYQDGTAPVSWNSSISILKKYMIQDYQPVKYGQCWVFSAIVVSILRCLCIPCRSVTNYSSAHDTDNTMTIDTFFTAQNEELAHSDSIWNFHVWNECWLQRPDLPPGYDGWQVIDATPQEEADGRAQCGPAPVKAIKQGHTFINYDTPFVFAEVNADSCYWLVDEDRNIEGLTHRSRSHVGKTISTTAPGMGIYDRLDLTSEYKQPEGSAGEEANFKRAFNYAAGRGNMKKFLFGKNDTPLEINVFYGETPKFGQPISLVMRLKNTSGFTISPSSLRLTANSVFQRGEVHKYLAQIEIDCGSIEAQTEKSLNCQVSYEDYRDKLAPDGQGFMRIQVLAQFNNQSASERVHICVEPPTEDLIDLELSHQTCFIGDENVKATICLTNKLDSLLLGGRLTVDGHNLFPTANYTVPALEIKSKVETVIDIKPTKAGTWTVVVNFATDQVVDMKVFKTIVVKN